MNKKLYALSLSSLFFSASYNILLPELPKYLIQIGGSNYLGYIILFFTISALVSRPLSGSLSDRRGGKFTILIGILVSILINFSYPYFTTVFGFLLLRFFHGFSTGFAPTGYTFFTKNNFKEQGKAISFQTAFFAAGMAIGPMLSSYITDNFGMNSLFYSGSLLGILALVFILPLKEEVPLSKPATNKAIIDFGVWRPATIMFWVYLSFGILLISSSIIALELGFKNKGIFYFCFTVSTIAIRLIVKDKFKENSLKKLFTIATTLLIIASLLFAFWSNKYGFILASLLYGAAMAIFVPGLNLWIFKKNSGEDGKAIATLYIFMELGIGLGAFLIGALIVKYQSSFSYVYACYSLMSVFLYSLFRKL